MFEFNDERDLPYFDGFRMIPSLSVYLQIEIDLSWSSFASAKITHGLLYKSLMIEKNRAMFC